MSTSTNQSSSALSGQPLNIGLLAPACRGYNALDGGIGSHFADLAASLAAAGHRVRVITPAPPANFVQSTAPAGVRFASFDPTMPRWLNKIAGVRWQLHSITSWWWRAHQASAATLAAHKTEAFDIIETSSSGLLAKTLLGHNRRRRPLIVTRISTTSGQLVTHNAGATRWIDRTEQKWERQLAERSDALVTHTILHREEVMRQWGFPESALNLVTHGIDVPADELLRSPANSANASATSKSPSFPISSNAGAGVRILYVGRFEHRKGIDVLLSAIPAVLAAAPDTHFNLIGLDANDYWQTRFWQENPTISRSRVSFAGKIDSDALLAAYRDCDVFVAPSRYESFGLIYVEAMAWAKPVIGCRAGGIPEVISDGESGLLVEPGDRETLAAALIKLVTDSALRERMGAAARTRVQNHFSRTALARNTVALFRRVIADADASKSLKS